MKIPDLLRRDQDFNRSPLDHVRTDAQFLDSQPMRNVVGDQQQGSGLPALQCNLRGKKRIFLCVDGAGWLLLRKPGWHKHSRTQKESAHKSTHLLQNCALQSSLYLKNYPT